MSSWNVSEVSVDVQQSSFVQRGIQRSVQSVRELRLRCFPGVWSSHFAFDTMRACMSA